MHLAYLSKKGKGQGHSLQVVMGCLYYPIQLWWEAPLSLSQVEAKKGEKEQGVRVDDEYGGVTWTSKGMGEKVCYECRGS